MTVRPPGKYADYVPNDVNRHRRPITENDGDITTSNQGNGNNYEEILDLSPSTDVMYEIKESAQLNIEDLTLYDGTGSELAGNAKLKFVVADPIERDDVTISREYTYNEFKNQDLRNDNEDKQIEFLVDGDRVFIPEDHHWKLMMNHDTAVDWSDANTAIEFELFEWS